MISRISLTVLAAILICNISAAIADPPVSASVSGVKNVGWAPGNCEVASFGQLVIQRDPTITPAEVVVRAGVCTQAAWVGSGKNRVLVDHPRFLNMGKRVDAARLFGLGYAVAWKPVGGKPYGIAKQADSLTTFNTTDEAVKRIKELLAAGTPVQVHVDTAELPFYGGNHGSHFVVVHGYDATSIYYCENGFSNGENENVNLSWADFISAWTGIAHVDPKYPGNECFMLWLTTDPVRLDNDWILAWLSRDIKMTNKSKSPTGPDAIRAAAEMIRNGADGDTVFNSWLRSIHANWRSYMIGFLDSAGHSDMAERFEQACEIWESINSTLNPDWSTVCDQMDEAADIEEEVEAELLGLVEDFEPVCLCSPEDGANLDTLEDCTFRWAQMPEVSKTVLQIAMDGDFANRRSTGTLTPDKYKWFVPMAKKDWFKVLSKDDNNRLLSWRVIGQGKDAGMVSIGRTLSWDIQQMVSEAPDSGRSLAEGELLTFTFGSPWIAEKPCVVISTTGDFNDKKSRIIIKPKSDQTSASFTKSTLSTLKKKDDGDKVVYWRAEDAYAKKTMVEPSEPRSLQLP
ncbi:exported hypothetical protein [uncultured Desulfobacterium sp.]|uniref:Butirosin biosynthesis protein H N-terminal domain-containing protein n=1 Tax=uncultured Desulfobacterium sp. TaxID=201089 RepID=A0A445MZ03_9BACT|nr:exported hypothetical protein [uncultured Desulfobacterium sp.]